MRSEPIRQNAIVDYMKSKNVDEGYTTREIATMLDCTTNAILSAMKRLRQKGRVYQWNNKWWLSGAERLKHAQSEKETSATEANTSGG